MPRPLHERNNSNPIKTPNNYVTSVGADRCVGPLRTCRFRTRAHTQVRPYKTTMVAPADHKREPGGPPPTGGLMMLEQTPEYPPAKRSGVQGHCPCVGPLRTCRLRARAHTKKPWRKMRHGFGLADEHQSMVFSSLSFLIMATASSKETVPRLSPLRLRMVTVLFSASRSPSTNMKGILFI